MPRFTFEQIREMERAVAEEERQQRAAERERKAEAKRTRTFFTKAVEQRRLQPVPGTRVQRPGQEVPQHVLEYEAAERRAQEEREADYWRAVEARRPPPRTIVSDGVEFETTWYPHRDADSLLGSRPERNEFYHTNQS